MLRLTLLRTINLMHRPLGRLLLAKHFGVVLVTCAVELQVLQCELLLLPSQGVDLLREQHVVVDQLLVVRLKEPQVL